MLSDNSVNKVWVILQNLTLYTILTLCLSFASGELNSQELDTTNTINLIPLPEAPPPESPLTAFQADQSTLPVDPKAAQLAERLLNYINNHQARQATNTPQIQLRSLPSDGQDAHAKRLGWQLERDYLSRKRH